jgi:hypothetical protein
MNNLVLLIIFILILFNFYYSYKCSKNYEKFTDLTPEQLKVITNLSPHLIGIKNLSDLATQLMTGNLTVPGGLLINGDITVKGKSTLSSDLNVNGKTTLANDTVINTNLQVNGSSTITGKTTLANDTTINGLTTMNKSLLINSDSVITGSLNMGNNINILGNLNLGKFQRKYMPGGFFNIKAYGRHGPLYNGWNVLWQDHLRTENLRTKIKWNGSTSQKYIHFSGISMVENTDSNWYPRFLAVMPGYVAAIYFYINGDNFGKSKVYFSGEYDWTDNADLSDAGLRVHYIALALEDELLPPDSFTVASTR